MVTSSSTRRLGSTAAWPVVARAQQPLPVIGWLSSRSAATDALLLPAFRQALNAQGFVEGRNITIEYRFADGQSDRLVALAADLVRRSPAAIVAVGATQVGTRAVQAVSTTVPIVGVFGVDPIKEGFSGRCWRASRGPWACPPARGIRFGGPAPASAWARLRRRPRGLRPQAGHSGRSRRRAKERMRSADDGNGKAPKIVPARVARLEGALDASKKH
jgi:hypothetical protein